MKNLSLSVRIIAALSFASLIVAISSYLFVAKLVEQQFISLQAQIVSGAAGISGQPPRQVNRQELEVGGIDKLLLEVFDRSPDISSQGFVSSKDNTLIFLKKNGDGTYQATEAKVGFLSFVSQKLPVFFAFVFGLVVIATALVFAMTRVSLEPLTSLRRTTEDILAGRFEVRMNYTAHDELGRTFQALKRLCSELEVKERDLEKVSDLAKKDGMTGLHNHRSFKEEFQKQINHAAKAKTPIGVVLLDVDHFKKFNDTYGHQQGDEVLRVVAKTLKATAGTSAFVARYGGEEFVVLFPGITSDNFKTVAEGLRTGIETSKVNHLTSPGKTLTVTSSFGGLYIEGSVIKAPSPDKAIDLTQYIEVCDQNLYQAKKHGRNRVVMTRWVENAV